MELITEVRVFEFFADGVLILTYNTVIGMTEEQGLIDLVNAFNALPTFGATFNPDTYFLTIYSKLLGDLGNGIVITVFMDGQLRLTATLANGGVQWCLGSTTDALAKKLIAIADEICGCPCGCNKNITNDVLPKYV